MRQFTVILVLGIAGVPTDLEAQSSEMDHDGESVAEQIALDETLERLRRSPIWLRTATVDELLQIPGVNRREAEAIVRAVRSGKIVERRSIDLLFGVRPGVAERLAPYVTDRDATEPRLLTTRLRSDATIVHEDGSTQLVRERIDLRLEGRAGTHDERTSRWEVRRTGLGDPTWFTYARIPSPVEGWSLTIGDLSVRNGSSLLDRGRRTSVLRPSDWAGRSDEDVKVQPGYDEGIATRGLSVEFVGGGRTVVAATAEQAKGGRSTTLAWSEQWLDGLESRYVRDEVSGLTAVRLTRRWQAWQISAEGAYGRMSPSNVASVSWTDEGQADVRWVFRRLRHVPASGVPRVGGRSFAEDAFSIAVNVSPRKGLRFHLVGDIGRGRDAGEQVVRWDAISSVGIGGLANFPDRSQVGGEWTRSSVGTRGSSRWTTRVQQPITPQLSFHLLATRRTETDEQGGQIDGRLSHATLSWRGTAMTMYVRWMNVAGDPSVEFWVLGPGPSSLSGLVRSSGRSSLLQWVATWRPGSGVEIGSSVTWRSRPTDVFRSSIRVEIHL